MAVTPVSRKSQLRNLLASELSDHNLHATPQAFSAICESIMRAPSDVAGDTDSLLLGLLYSGSYTVDVLETASANPYDLRRLAEKSVKSLIRPFELPDDVQTQSDSETLWRILSKHSDLPYEFRTHGNTFI